MQQHELAAEAIAPGVQSGHGYLLAHRISQIFHPIGVSMIGFVLLGLLAVPNWLAGLGWAAFCILVQIVPTMTFYLIRLRQGVYSDQDISIRHQRHELYMFTTTAMAIGLALLVLMGAPRPFVALLVCGLLVNVANGLVNLFWKISAHATAMAILATVTIIYAHFLGVLLWGCALAVGWSRVRTRNHTPLQVMAGLGLTTLIVLGVFLASGLITMG
jgi:membrane-associated phospholipid phosphatase